MLRTLEYPGSGDFSASPLDLANRPHDLAKIVSWIEDRKVGSVRWRVCVANDWGEGLLLAVSRDPKWECARFAYTIEHMAQPLKFRPASCDFCVLNLVSS